MHFSNIPLPFQEQLRHKQRFNFIAFDTKAYCWKDRLVEVNEKNLHTAWQWIKELVCRGSTNTLGALRHALADHQTQAIYLLSDGRPDQVWFLPVFCEIERRLRKVIQCIY